MYKIDKNMHGFYIVKTENGKNTYLSKIGRNNNYVFLLDYTYTRYFSKETAEKHLNILKREAKQ